MYGVLAGMYISLGAAGALVVTSTSLDAAIAKVLAGILFSVGLMLVLIPGAELFTGNILMASGIIDKRYHFVKMFRNWIVVYLGNFIGALFIAWLFFGSGYLGDVELNNIGQNIVKIAAAKMSLGFFSCSF
jgi:formate/nitrite transporter FocA (FNT family)